MLIKLSIFAYNLIMFYRVFWSRIVIDGSGFVSFNHFHFECKIWDWLEKVWFVRGWWEEISQNLPSLRTTFRIIVKLSENWKMYIRVQKWLLVGFLSMFSRDNSQVVWFVMLWKKSLRVRWLRKLVKSYSISELSNWWGKAICKAKFGGIVVCPLNFIQLFVRTRL